MYIRDTSDFLSVVLPNSLVFVDKYVLCMHKSRHVCVYIHVYVCVHVCVYIHVYVCVHVCVYTYDAYMNTNVHT